MRVESKLGLKLIFIFSGGKVFGVFREKYIGAADYDLIHIKELLPSLSEGWNRNRVYNIREGIRQ